MLIKKPGAGRRDRTDILSLEGCCTTIVLYPRGDCGSSGERRSRFLSGVLIRRIRPRRVVGEEGLEPSKLTQGIYSPPPLPLGTFPQRALSNRRTLVPPMKDAGRNKSLRLVASSAVEGAPRPESPWGSKSEGVL